MDYTIVTDTAANLPERVLKAHHIATVPLSYTLGNVEFACPTPEEFQGHEFYEALRKRANVKTSLANTHTFLKVLEPIAAAGRDILYVGVSSGISGTFASGAAAQATLCGQYPDNRFLALDTLAASLGEGLLVIKAALLREAGKTMQETADFLERAREKMNQVFIVDDLMHLRRGGRISSLTSVLGSVLHIKPILKGDAAGKIASCGKVRGRKASLRAILDEYLRNAENASEQTIAISHADCEDDANTLADMLRDSAKPPKEILIEMFEPISGSHVGPGALALFFEGRKRE